MLGNQLTIPLFGSCRSSDVDFDPVIVRIRKRIDVLLHGQPVQNVVAYNCEQGWVCALKVHANGATVVENGIAAEQILHGSVTVRWR
jgi:hypothetical protein